LLFFWHMLASFACPTQIILKCLDFLDLRGSWHTENNDSFLMLMMEN
jgi:hypothetical protein